MSYSWCPGHAHWTCHLWATCGIKYSGVEIEPDICWFESFMEDHELALDWVNRFEGLAHKEVGCFLSPHLYTELTQFCVLFISLEDGWTLSRLHLNISKMYIDEFYWEPITNLNPFIIVIIGISTSEIGGHAKFIIIKIKHLING